MLHRQRIVLETLRECGGECDRLRLVKLIFLLSRDRDESSFYDFVPYRHGPFSFGLYHELQKLADLGFISGADKKISLTDLDDRPVTRRSDAAQVRALVSSLVSVETGDLLDQVYEDHPWYTALAKNHRARGSEVPSAELAVYTAGYEGRQIDGFLDLLLRSGIRHVIDTRANPVSRRYGFHGSTLRRLCGRLDMTYEHRPGLGIASSARREEVSRSQLLDDYEAGTLHDHADEVDGLAATVRRQPSVLVCSEADPCVCHRSRLAHAVAERADLPVVHLGTEPAQVGSLL